MEMILWINTGFIILNTMTLLWIYVKHLTFKLRVILLNIIKKMSEIGPFRKPLSLYSSPPSLSREDATKWVKGISQGEIGGLEVFLNEKEVSIQLMNYRPCFR